MEGFTTAPLPNLVGIEMWLELSAFRPSLRDNSRNQGIYSQNWIVGPNAILRNRRYGRNCGGKRQSRASRSRDHNFATTSPAAEIA